MLFSKSSAGDRKRLNLLLLCDFNDRTAGTIVDHIRGIRDHSKHKVYVLSSMGELPVRLDLSKFDGIIIHYSLVACLDAFIGPNTRRAIREFQGIKVVFIQDDYRFIDMTVAALRDLQIHVLLGLAPPDIIDQVYPPEKLPGVLRLTVLAGYVPEHLTRRNAPPLLDRPIDVGYRARKLPAWLGSHGKEKWVIAERFLSDVEGLDLKCDISTREADRIYGPDWIQFVTNCKAMLGTESGSGVCDFTGEIQLAVENHLSRHPMATFEELRDLYFIEEDGRIMMNVISPRCFEAAALRTLMILYEGSYSGRLVPWRHYVPLKKDHSNIEEVVSILRNPARAQQIVDNAYQEVALNRTNWFESMVAELDVAIDQRFEHGMRSLEAPYSDQAFSKVLQVAKRKQAKRQYLQRLGVAVIPWIDRTLSLLPPPAMLKIRNFLRSVWLVLHGGETPQVRYAKTVVRLARTRGFGAFKTLSMCREYPVTLESEVSTFAALLASNGGLVSAVFSGSPGSLEICFGRSMKRKQISPPELQEAFRLKSIKHINWRVDGTAATDMHGVSEGSFQGLALIGKDDPAFAADLLSRLLWSKKATVLIDRVR